jgi:hypothetical protein
MKHVWKLWLRLNPFNKNANNEYTASVSTLGKKALRNADIARIIKDSGSELKLETIQYILDKNDRIIREQVQRGHSVLTGAAQFTPRVQGVWQSANAKYDSARHKIGLHIIPSAEMRAAFKEIGIEMLGVKPGGAYIGLVTDTTTGLTDGTMTSGDDILIEGEKLKIAPDGENGTGVFFVNLEDETVTPVLRRLTQNDPKKLLARVPDLPAGQYILRVVTQFTAGATLLKEPRVIEYDRPLVIN